MTTIATRQDAELAARIAIAGAVSGATSMATFDDEHGATLESVEIEWTLLQGDRDLEGLYFHVYGEDAAWLLDRLDRHVAVWAQFAGGTLGSVDANPKVEIVKIDNDTVSCSIDTMELEETAWKSRRVEFREDDEGWLCYRADGTVESATDCEVMGELESNPFASVDGHGMLAGSFDTVEALAEWAGIECQEE